MLVKWHNKNIVVVATNGETTCKRIHVYDDHALLVSENPNYPPVVVTDEMWIVGPVMGISREFVAGWQP